MTTSTGDLLVMLGGGRDAAQPWLDTFRARLPGWRVLAPGDPLPPEGPRFAATWNHPPGALRDFKNLRAIFSLGAGVDHLLADPALPPGVPVVRVVDPDLTSRMSEWVVMHVLVHHRQAQRFARQQSESRWEDDPLQPAAGSTRVGIMGLGVLGRDAATKLRVMGFDVAGWSRAPKAVPDVRCFAGEAERGAFLARTQVLVALLPLTSATRGVLNATLFRQLARDGHCGGPVLVNAGRGGLQNEADIVRCLDDGTLAAATLDVFEREPLPVRSPLWRHPAVTVTPHNAAISSPGAVVNSIAAAIEAHGRGEPLPHLVDRERGY